MSNLFKAIDSIFESNRIVLTEAELNERGSKYLKPDPDNKYNNIDDRGISKPKNKNDYEYRQGRLLKPGFERYLYDVVKHLNPAGCSIFFSRAYEKDTYNVNLKDSDGENFNIGSLKIFINDNDEVEIKTKPSNYNIPNIFGKKASIKEIGQQLAREKGANYDEDFVIDNGTEIRDRFNNQKTEGTVDELLAKIEKQIKKLPSNKLIGYTESVEVTSTKLDEAFSDSCPNWLKMTLKKQNADHSSWWPALFSEDTEFVPVPTDKIKGKNGLTTVAKEAYAVGEELFVRTKQGVFGFWDNKWRSLNNSNFYLSSEEVGESIIAAVKTTNKKAVRDDMEATQKSRADARDGSIDRKKDLSKWDVEDGSYDKSGYRLNPVKYQNMLRDLNRSKAASSELINFLKQEDYVNRFNEIGQKAAEFIKDSLNVSFDKTSYSGFDTRIVDTIKQLAGSAKAAIDDLMNKVNYIKTGQDSSYYGSNKPKGTDVESWIRQEMEKTDRALSNFEDIVTKAEDMTESVKISDISLNETEYTPNARKCIDAANLLGQIDLKDIEDAAKIKDQVERLFDKLVKLAPKLNKKEQKEIEEASKCDEEDSESLKAGKANMEKLRKQNGFSKSDEVEFVNGEAQTDLEKKAEEVKQAFNKESE